MIALIATPIVLSVIEKAEKSAFEDSAYGLISAAQLQYTEEILDHKSPSKIYIFPTNELKYNGKSPQGGELRIDSTGKVNLAIHNGTWCITKGIYDSEVHIEKYEEETCKLEEIDYAPEKCFQTKPYAEIKYTVIPENCITYFINQGMDNEDASTFCNGGVANGNSLDNAIQEGAALALALLDIIHIESNGIEYTVDTQKCTEYYIASGRTSEESSAFCNKEGEIYGITLDELVKVGINVLSSEELENAGITIIDGSFNAVTIEKYKKSDIDCPMDVIIPETIKGKKIENIASYAFVEHRDGYNVTASDDRYITSVVFPSSLKVISSSAFVGTENGKTLNQITSLDFSKAINLTRIQESAFADNPLINVDFGEINQLQFIGKRAFCNVCNLPESFNIPSSVTYFNNTCCS